MIFLDILGYKGLWNRYGSEELITKLLKIKRDTFLEKKGYNTVYGKVQKEKLDFIMYTFSDTFIITVEELKGSPENGNKNTRLNNGRSIKPAMEIASVIFDMAIKEHILLRGVISYGEFFTVKKQNILLGPAIDEAGDWYDKANWSGIHLTPTANFKFQSQYLDQEILEDYMAQKYPKNLLTMEYEVPLKNNEHFFTHVINWLNAGYDPMDGLTSEDLKDYSIHQKKNILDLFSDKEIGSITVNIKDKFINTIQFVDFVIDYWNNNNYNKSETASLK